MSEAGKHQLGVGARLDQAPSAALIESFGHELRYARALYEGVSYADIAHVLALTDAGVIPAGAGRRLIAALVDLHDGGLDAVPLDPKWGDIYNNRDAELRRRLGDDAGWLHAGRARREALTIGWLLHLRAAGADTLRAAATLADTIAAVATDHGGTLMPDFTYLQHAHPTTLGHFLLGFAYPVLRDAERLAAELRRSDECPAGSGSTNGTRLPIDRRRLAEMLGFPELTVHNRDAMWRSDVPINLMGVLTSLATTADRLAEELQLWATAEFGYVELADRHCRTSVIMPHKKNPYALSHIRGKARELGGKLVSVVATNQTPSGQLDNRNASYELLPEALATVRNLATLLGEVVSGSRFDTERMRRQAEEGFTFGTELADLLMEREAIDPRTAHEIVGRVVARQLAGGTKAGLAECVTDTFREVAGRHPRTDARSLLPELSAARIVENRRTLGGCSPQSVRDMCAAVRRGAAAVVKDLDAAAEASNFPALLRRRVQEHLGRHW